MAIFGFATEGLGFATGDGLVQIDRDCLWMISSAW